MKAYETRERQPEKEEVCRALVSTDFAEGDGAGFVAAGFSLTYTHNKITSQLGVLRGCEGDPGWEEKTDHLRHRFVFSFLVSRLCFSVLFCRLWRAVLLSFLSLWVGRSRCAWRFVVWFSPLRAVDWEEGFLMRLETRISE